jgi:processive 1,2-diacylglycerol beta-glucosyltransferase
MAIQKILILHASAGSGHKKAAEALEHAARAQGHNVTTLDIVSFFPPLTRWLYCKGYLWVISHMPGLWGLLYFVSDTPLLALLNETLRRFLNGLLCRRLRTYLLEEKPAVVISTHFLASEIVAAAKKRGELTTQLITVITDFGVHRFWLNPQTDIYACATARTKDILLEKGVPVSRIAVTGIPLDEKFRQPLTRDALTQELNLSKNSFTILIATGGIGVGPIQEIVSSLKDDAQILVICGTNKKLYAELSEKNYSSVRVFKFVDFMHKLMKVSDTIITKAGGLTVTESLAMGLSPVFFYLIPGQESINAATISAEGAGFIAKTPGAVRECILNLKNDAAFFAATREKSLGLARPDSCQHILSLIHS